MKVPCLIIGLCTPPVENGPEVYLHQLPLRAMTDVAEYPGKHACCFSVYTSHTGGNDQASELHAVKLLLKIETCPVTLQFMGSMVNYSFSREESIFFHRDDQI